MLVEPFAALDKLGAVIAEMGDRAAEAGHAEAQKDAQHLESRAALRHRRGGLVSRRSNRLDGPPHQAEVRLGAAAAR